MKADEKKECYILNASRFKDSIFNLPECVVIVKPTSAITKVGKILKVSEMEPPEIENVETVVGMSPQITYEDIKVKNARARGNFREARKIALEQKKACEICGIAEPLVVHHIDGNRENNTPENLQVLCWNCHMKIHGKLGKV